MKTLPLAFVFFAAARLEAVAQNLNATLVIQHEPNNIARLPGFSDSAK